jgi:hypothetical protein
MQAHGHAYFEFSHFSPTLFFVCFPPFPRRHGVVVPPDAQTAGLGCFFHLLPFLAFGDPAILRIHPRLSCCHQVILGQCTVRKDDKGHFPAILVLVERFNPDGLSEYQIFQKDLALSATSLLHLRGIYAIQAHLDFFLANTNTNSVSVRNTKDNVRYFSHIAKLK